jgi:hypothetical protein
MAERFRFEAGTNIQRALELGERVEEAFRRLGLKCVNTRNEMCVAAEVETLADAARYHDLDLERILSELNRLDLPSRS